MNPGTVTPRTSAEVNAAWQSPGRLRDRLEAACTEEWMRYLSNEFIWHIADGTLPSSAYREQV